MDRLLETRGGLLRSAWLYDAFTHDNYQQTVAPCVVLPDGSIVLPRVSPSSPLSGMKEMLTKVVRTMGYNAKEPMRTYLKKAGFADG